MVAGFEHPEGDEGRLDAAATTLQGMAGDLDSYAGDLRNGFDQALKEWKARRAKGFEAVGTRVDHSLNAGTGLIEGAAGALGIYAAVLKQAKNDIDDLKQKATNRLNNANADTSGPDGGPDPEVISAADTAVRGWRQEAAEIRRETKKKASTAAEALNSAVGRLVPGGDKLTADQIAAKVHQASGVDQALKAMANNELTLPEAWKGLGGDPSSGTNPLETFFNTWGGFKPPESEDPVSYTLYAIGKMGTAGSRIAAWMTKVNHGRFMPRGADGKLIKIAGMTFWERLKAGAGRFPGARGLTPWERLKGFDKGGNFGAKGWRGGQYSKWSTAGKWIGRTGTVVTAAVAGWSEWQDSAGYPTDERLGRSVTKGATTAAGAWAGAEVGAWAGGAIGTAICPGVGTVIGGLLGGLIGGFAGSQLGAALGDTIKDVGGEIGDKIGDAVGWVGSKLGFG